MYRWGVAISFTLDVSVDSFDAAAQQAFKVNLAALLDGDADAMEIERRKEAFQAKKARRLERKAAAAEGAE